MNEFGDTLKRKWTIPNYCLRRRATMARQVKTLNFAKAFGETFQDFARNSTMHGFQYLVHKPDRTLLERCIWWTIQIISVYAVVWLVLFAWHQFMEDPTVTTLETPYYPITEILFPGVSICNINKISRRRAMAYAEELANKTGIPHSKLFESTKLFGKLYDFAQGTTDDILLEFQSILEAHDADPETGIFNPYLTLRKLAQPCSDLVSNCSWNGERYNCEDLFIYETTMEGFCCIFNYLPPVRAPKASAILEENNFQSLKAKRSGIKGGLTVAVHPERDDYYYAYVSSEGANVHIFNSNDFPDTSSGSLQERMVAIGLEMFVRIFATTVYTAPEVKRYSINKRNCKFREESNTLFGAGYSFSDCVLDCRLKSMYALCNCIPFNFIKAIHGPQMPQCTVVDIPCLERYKEKWRRLYPADYEGSELDSDKQDSLDCRDCKPTCSNTLYTVRNDFAYFTTPSQPVLNYSIINVFFEREKAELYRQDVVYYWFEIVSSFGGTCSLMMGVSLLSIAEFVYFFTIRFYKHLYHDD